MKTGLIAIALMVLGGLGSIGLATNPATSAGEDPPTSAAEERPTSTSRSPGADSVHATYRFTLPTSMLEERPLPSILVEIARAPALAGLRVSRGADGDGAEVSVEFAFESAEELAAWNERSEVVSLFHELESAAPESAPLLQSLTVRSPGADGRVVGRVDPSGGGSGRRVESVSCNYDCTRIDITYRTRGNDVSVGGTNDDDGDSTGGEGRSSDAGTGGTIEDVGDLDALTMICIPDDRGSLSRCEASN